MSNFHIWWAFNKLSMSRAHSPSFPSLHLRHSSFSNPSLALPTSQLILQPSHHFTYVTDHSPTLLSPLLYHRIFTYVTWRAAHEMHYVFIIMPHILKAEEQIILTNIVQLTQSIIALFSLFLLPISPQRCGTLGQGLVRNLSLPLTKNVQFPKEIMRQWKMLKSEKQRNVYARQLESVAHQT